MYISGENRTVTVENTVGNESSAEPDTENDNTILEPDIAVVQQENIIGEGKCYNDCFLSFHSSGKHIATHFPWSHHSWDESVQKERLKKSSDNQETGHILIKIFLCLTGFFLLFLLFVILMLTLARTEQLQVTRHTEHGDGEELISEEVSEDKPRHDETSTFDYVKNWAFTIVNCFLTLFLRSVGVLSTILPAGDYIQVI